MLSSLLLASSVSEQADQLSDEVRIVSIFCWLGFDLVSPSIYL